MTEYVRPAQIAKELRAAVKAARTEGPLANLPDGVTLSITTESYSMGCSIDVTIKDAPAEWYQTNAGDRIDPDRWVVSDAAQAVGDHLLEMAAKARRQYDHYFSTGVYVGGGVVVSSYYHG